MILWIFFVILFSLGLCGIIFCGLVGLWLVGIKLKLNSGILWLFIDDKIILEIGIISVFRISI